MSAIIKMKCDHCGREVVDKYAEIGWLYLGSNNASLTLTKGKNSKKDALAKSIPLNEKDFCNLACFVAWVSKALGLDTQNNTEKQDSYTGNANIANDPEII